MNLRIIYQECQECHKIVNQVIAWNHMKICPDCWNKIPIKGATK